MEPKDGLRVKEWYANDCSSLAGGMQRMTKRSSILARRVAALAARILASIRTLSHCSQWESAVRVLRPNIHRCIHEAVVTSACNSPKFPHQQCSASQCNICSSLTAFQLARLNSFPIHNIMETGCEDTNNRVGSHIWKAEGR